MRIAAVIACLVLAVAAFGCGEKDEPATTGAVVTESTTSTSTTTTTTTVKDRPDPRELVSYFLTGTPASGLDICSEGLTSSFLKQAYGGRPGCVASRKPSALAKQAAIISGAESGSRATVVVKATGGVYGGDRLTVTLVKQGDQWLIDDIKSDAPVGP